MKKDDGLVMDDGAESETRKKLWIDLINILKIIIIYK